ncbi:MAG: hypothetical protein P1U56_25890 [Saprospiraceae bacterium]|nr:hypothetical protein [Saprospiraceae bacterium]
MTSESNSRKSSNFESPEDAFEFLIQESQNEVRKAKWRRELEGIVEQDGNRGKANYRKLILYVVGSTAIALLLFGRIHFLQKTNNTLEVLVNQMVDEIKIILVSDRVLVDSDTSGVVNFKYFLQNNIHQALRKNHFEVAYNLYVRKETQVALSNEDKFNYALAILKKESGDRYKGIDLLGEVLLSDNELHNEALWVQSLLYLKTNQQEKAKSVLNKLINTSCYRCRSAKILLHHMSRKSV